MKDSTIGALIILVAIGAAGIATITMVHKIYVEICGLLINLISAIH